MATEVIQIPRDAAGTGAPALVAAIRRASEVLEAGGLVVFPTETVYGLAARVDRPDALARLRAIKSRPETKAFTVHIGSREALSSFAPNAPNLAWRLARKAWPGPLTMVLKVDDPQSSPIMAGLNGTALAAMYYENTIGLRFPDDRIAVELLMSAGAPVVAASANPAGAPPPREVADMPPDFSAGIDLVLEAGPSKYQKASTIVRVDQTGYTLLREGVYDAGIVERLMTLRILFVCTGNTCRSPMAEGFAKKMLADRLDCPVGELAKHGVIVSSAGVAGGYGSASENTVAVLASRGADMSQHRSTHLTADMVRLADHVYVMTEAHRRAVLELAPEAQERVSLLLETDDVDDPVGGGLDVYEANARLIEAGVRHRLQEVSL